MRGFGLFRLTAPVLITALAGCGGSSVRERQLLARRMALQHEVEGLRQMVERLSRGEPVVAPADVAVSIDERLLRELIAAQLPFEAEIEGYRVRLNAVEVQLRGNAVVRLRGVVSRGDRPDLAGTLTALGAIEQIAIDRASGTLRAKVAIDQIEIEKAAGLERVLSHGALERLGVVVREQLLTLLAPVEIPVRVQPEVAFPALTTGPVRIEGGALPLQVDITRVQAGRGQLWVGVSVRPGGITKRGGTP